MKKQNVILVCRSGGSFSFEDVRLLSYHLRKQSPDIEVYCLTDKPTPAYEAINVTAIKLQYDWPGWWAKMNLFSPELEHLRPFLYVDLDTAIVGDLKNILPPFGLHANKFITLQDFYQHGKLASGVLWIPADNDKVRIVWENHLKKSNTLNRRKRMDYFLRENIKPDAFWQNITNKISSYKPTQREHLTTLPAGVSVVCFHGRPKIGKVAGVDWVRKYKSMEL